MYAASQKEAVPELNFNKCPALNNIFAEQGVWLNSWAYGSN
jgi:hypothetical protein